MLAERIQLTRLASVVREYKYRNYNPSPFIEKGVPYVTQIGETTIINMRGGRGCLPGEIRIDRGSKWGNPFSLNKPNSKKERSLVLEKYKSYLRKAYEDGTFTIEDFASLSGRTLACWCVPQSCHGILLAKYANRAKQVLQQRSVV